MIVLLLVTIAVMICVTVVATVVFMGAMVELQEGNWGELLISILAFCAFSVIGYLTLETFSTALRVANY